MEKSNAGKQSLALKIFALSLFCLMFLFMLLGCASPDGNFGADSNGQIMISLPTERGDSFSEINERGFTKTADCASSAFSLSTSRSSYSYMRRAVNAGRLPSADSVRIEEYINYFDYEIALPQDGDFSTVANVFDCGWNDAHKLLRVSYAARETERAVAPNNLVFLVDISASMYGADRIGLFKTALEYVAEALGEFDRISLVTYAGAVRVLIDGADASRRDELLESANSLQASGGTAGESAIEKAYSLAKKNFLPQGNNRIILFTDGDFNVGAKSPAELETLVKKGRNGGIYFTSVGVGYGNYKDDVLEVLANAGNGEAYYLDGESEAKRVFGEELAGTLFTVAADAKANVLFDPSQVESFRLIGYDNRMLTGVEFEDEKTDAGEVGSGKQITALFEIVPAQSCEIDLPFATAELRYKIPNGGEEKSLTVKIEKGEENPDDIFIGCVAEYGLLLRRSEYAQNASFESLETRLYSLTLSDDVYKTEFKEIVRKARGIYSKSRY